MAISGWVAVLRCSSSKSESGIHILLMSCSASPVYGCHQDCPGIIQPEDGEKQREGDKQTKNRETAHSLTEDKGDNHLFNSAHIPGIRAPHIIPHPCKRVWEIQSLAEQLTPRNSSAL